MNLRIKLNTGKNDILFDTKESARESANLMDSNHFFRVTLDVFASKEELDGKEDIDGIPDEDAVHVAELEAYAIDEMECTNDGLDPVVLADEESVLLADMVSSMMESKKYEEMCLDTEWQPLLSICLTRLYVFPEYRNKGIGSYLFDNLGYIFKIFLNKNIHGVVTPPIDSYVDEEPTPKENAEMTKKVIKQLKRVGFGLVGDLGCYMKNYAETLMD